MAALSQKLQIIIEAQDKASGALRDVNTQAGALGTNMGTAQTKAKGMLGAGPGGLVGLAGKATIAMGAIAGAAGIGAVVAGLKDSLEVAGKFEASMSRVGALSGAGETELAALSNTAKELGATTRFGATEIAEGMSYLAMAGYETNDIIDAMPGLLDVAAASQSDLGTTAQSVKHSAGAVT